MTPEGIFTLSTDGTQYPILLPHVDTDYIQGMIVQSREPYEHTMLKAIAAAVGEDATILDVGANIGNHTLWLAHVAGARVWAFEPNPELSTALSQSVEIGALEDRVRVFNCAIGRADGNGTLVEVDESNLGGYRMDTSRTGDVQVVTLDSLGVPPVSAMKIDVEGMELDVLAGSMGVIERDRPHLFIEAMDTPAFNALIDVLEPLGYTCIATYNATPTHHFAPDVGEATALRTRIHALVGESQSILADYQRTRADLVATSLKYRDVAQRNKELRARVRRLRRRLAHGESDQMNRSVAPIRLVRRALKQFRRRP